MAGVWTSVVAHTSTYASRLLGGPFMTMDYVSLPGERVVTTQEWTAMADHSVGAIPRSRLLPQLGMLLANSAPADRKSFYAGRPFSVKVLWRLVGKRQYAKQFRLLFPGQARPADRLTPGTTGKEPAMEQPRPIVVRPDQGVQPPGPPTPGMDRHQLLDREDCWVGWVQTDAGLAGGWHHHGARDSYIYVLRGTVTIEYGPAGREQVTAVAGDFVFNPAGMVHREITAPDGPAELFVIRVGTGPQNVNVDGPDHA